MKIRIVFFFMLLSPMVAMAQCHLDGQVYEEGAQVGGYTCRAGQWV